MEEKYIRTEDDPFEMLEELLWQDQFELVFSEKGSDEKKEYESEKYRSKSAKLQDCEKQESNRKKPGKKSEIRLIYLMNDAVESFLVFVNAKMTGQYQPDYEGELEAELSREDMESGSTYVLVVHQGDSVVTLFFEDLKVETHLYRYGDLGHFWVKGYEYLRQLEYRIAILHTKCEYLGENAASEEERKLAELVHFPPLNYACYPAVSQKYIVPMDGVWEPTEQAISIMEELAAEASDHRLLRWLAFYRKHYGKGMSRLLAWMMHRVRHGAVVDLLIEKLMCVSACYSVRTYENDCDRWRKSKSDLEKNALELSEVGNESDDEETVEQYHEKLLMRAMQRKVELESQGKKVTLVREEPFTTAQDSVEYNVYLMIWKEKWGNWVVEVEHFF